MFDTREAEPTSVLQPDMHAAIGSGLFAIAPGSGLTTRSISRVMALVTRPDFLLPRLADCEAITLLHFLEGENSGSFSFSLDVFVKSTVSWIGV